MKMELKRQQRCTRGNNFFVSVLFTFICFTSCDDGKRIDTKSEDGAIVESLFLDDSGAPVKKVKYFETGAVQEIIRFTSDTSHVFIERYYPNGSLALKGSRVNGKLDGAVAEFDEKGHLLDIWEYIAIEDRHRVNQSWSFKNGQFNGARSVDRFVSCKDTLSLNDTCTFTFAISIPVFRDGMEVLYIQKDLSGENISVPDSVYSKEYWQKWEVIARARGDYMLWFRVSEIGRDTLPDGAIEETRLASYIWKIIHVN